MAISSLEIIQLATGEVIVRRAGQDADPLLTLDFSEESKAYIADATLDIARAMVQAGIETAVELGLVDENGEVAAEQDGVDADHKTLH